MHLAAFGAGAAIGAAPVGGDAREPLGAGGEPPGPSEPEGLASAVEDVTDGSGVFVELFEHEPARVGQQLAAPAR